MKPILSTQYLAWRLGIPASRLIQLAREVDQHYHEWSKTDCKTGKIRNFKVPDKELKAVQRRILNNILVEFPLSDGAHGGIRGRSPKTNAAQHLGTPLVVNIDIRDFFPSVNHRQVAKMFRREFGCGRQTTWLLARLTTVNGQLPQGSPTSTMIANILLATPVDNLIEIQARELDINNTRFVDDFSFSGEYADVLINDTAKAVSRVGLRTWRKKEKLKIMPRYRRQEVTGLIVNSTDGPSIAKEKRSRIKAAIHQLNTIPDREYEKAVRSVEGRLHYLAQYNPGSAERLRRQFVEIQRHRHRQ